MGRAPCCDKANVKKGPWSPQEDAKLKDYIEKHGTGGNWITLPKKVGLIRCGKSCRLRWLNYLRPNIKHGDFSDLEDQIICTLFASIGSRWSIIASHLQGRTDNDVKNYWNTKLKKKIMAINNSIEMKTQQITLLPYHSQESFTGSFSYSSTSSLLSGHSSTSAAQASFNIGPTEKCQLFKDINVIDQELVAKCGDENFVQQNIGDINYLYSDVEDSEKLMFSNDENGLWGENTLDYGLDEINKEIISTNTSSCKKFLFDE